MEQGKRIFVWVCAICGLFIALMSIDFVSKHNQCKQLETMKISVEPEAFGCFNQNEYDTYNSYDGVTASIPSFIGISLMEAPNEIVSVNTHCAVNFSHGDSVWVVKGYLFHHQPSVDDVRGIMIKVLREQSPSWITFCVMIAALGIIIWGAKKIFL